MRFEHKILGLTAFALTSTGAFAQNDECTGAIALAVGPGLAFDTTTATASAQPWPCAAGGAPDLWYTVMSPNAGATLVIETCTSTYDTALETFDGTCAALNPLSCNDDACGVQSTVTITGVVAGQNYFVRVGGWSGSTGTGTITLTELPQAPPASGSLPSWNSAVGTGTLPSYVNSGYITSTTDDIGLTNGAGGVTYEFLVHGTNFGNSSGLMGALNPPVGDSGGMKFEQWQNSMQYGITQFGVVDLYYPGANIENADTHLVFVADTTAGATELFVNGVSQGTQPYAPVLQGIQGLGRIYNPNGNPVDVFNGALYGVAVYESMLSQAEIQAHHNAYFVGLGTVYCSPNVANSTGSAGDISASGSNVAMDNDVTLFATSLPNGQFGYFLNAMSQAFIPGPGGSQGDLCLGGATGRYNAFVFNSGSTGEGSLILDLTNTPTPTGPVGVFPGETWYFQCWYRDLNPAATSNFTSAVCITFM